jgi:DNA-binding transcriptional ArsR family regulator
VNQLAEPFDLKLPTVSKHLKVLQRAGLVRQGRKAQWRPCRLDPAPLRDVADWVDRYQRLWEERYGRLDAYLVELQEKEKSDERKP